MPDPKALANPAALTRWLDAHAPEIGAEPLEIGFLHGGTSNVILTIDRGGAPAVLRRPPPVAPPNSEKAMMREARLLTALGGSDVPHPRLYGMCSDPGLIGAPFYVMARIDGWAPELGERGCSYPALFDRAERRREMGFAMVDALASLARVDPDAIGLSDFGKPGNFLERQVDRWLGQLAAYPLRYPAYTPRALPGIEEVAAWLRTHLPADQRRGIVHGDFGPPNILFDPAPPTRVRAIIDWELATIGDPLFDLALLLCNLCDAAEPEAIPPAAYFDPTDFPTRQEMIARYAALTGRDMGGFDYYLVLAQFRMACILEYKVAAAAGRRAEAGAMAIFPDMVINLMRQAHTMVRCQAG
ncbi:phosphotransferase family protein [Flavisphingomonas formosensis]|uniref:phosphotransferase family protein n=1 Tax=Flavisphingomonas formosensis TaxID=861534 RepID=UPI0012F855EB|nr:phosphotransferase family protein [Sphingomonas formosensis]